MSCNITAGIPTGCNSNIGGVKNVYLGNGPVVTTWYKYEMDKGTASLVETYNVNQAASIIGYTQTLTIQLAKMAADKQVQIAKIAEANGMQVLVETNEGSTFEMGYDPLGSRSAYLASGTTTSGTAYTDANQSELVIQAHGKQPMLAVDLDAILGTLIVDVRDTRTSPLGVSPDCGPANNNYIYANENILLDTYGSWSEYGCGEINTFTAAMGLTYPFKIHWAVEVGITIHTAMPDSLWQEFRTQWALNVDYPTDLVPARVIGIPQANPGVAQLTVNALANYDIQGPGSSTGSSGMIICNPYGPPGGCPDFRSYADQTISVIKIYERA